MTAASSTPDTQELLECSAGDVTIIIGPRAVGKSSVSWGMVTSNEDLAILRHSVRPAPVQALRLAASPDTLWERIRARSVGSPARLINDDLENATPGVQRHVHRVAVGQNVEYAASNLGDDVIDTTNLCTEEAVEQAL